MIDIKNKQGTKEASKSLIFGDDVVYVHSNIKKISDNLYQYDEKQYSLEEWKDVKDRYCAEQVASLEAAMCDIYEMLLSKSS